MKKAWWPGVGRVDVLAPGVYADVDGNIHFEVREILEYLRAADTAENRALVAEKLTGEARRLGAHISIDARVQG